MADENRKAAIEMVAQELRGTSPTYRYGWDVADEKIKDQYRAQAAALIDKIEPLLTTAPKIKPLQWLPTPYNGWKRGRLIATGIGHSVTRVDDAVWTTTCTLKTLDSEAAACAAVQAWHEEQVRGWIEGDGA